MHVVQRGDTNPGLKPIGELDNVGVLEALKHVKLIVNHTLVTLYILLEDNLHSNFSAGAVRFSDYAVCTSSQGSAKAVFRPDDA